MTDRSSCQQKDPSDMYFAGLLTAICVARSATGSPYSRLKPCFLALPGKNDPHIRIPAAFPGPDGVKHEAKSASILEPLVCI
jgi:hypothetical protein